MEKTVNNLIIENVRIIFRNFEGRPSKFNREGDRNFSVLIEDPELAQKLIDDGWNVRILRPRDDEEEPRYHLQVKVKYSENLSRNPRVFMHTRRNMSVLDAETIGNLDHADIVSADVVIRPYQYDVNGKQGISAYLKTMHVTIEEDEFADKYAMEEHPSDDMPF